MTRFFDIISEDVERLILGFVGYKEVCEMTPFGDGEQTLMDWVKYYNWKGVCRNWRAISDAL